MNDVLHISIELNGVLSSIPFIIKLSLLYFVGLISDLIISRNYFSITNTRKLFVFVGNKNRNGNLFLEQKRSNLDDKLHHAIAFKLQLLINGTNFSQVQQ